MHSKLIMIYIVVCGLLLIVMGCPNPDSEVKPVRPDKNESPASARIENQMLPARGVSLDASLDENIAISVNNSNHFGKIASACGYYQNAYGAVPQKLEDLMNGFMLAWPGCPYTDEPIKIINQMPDPQNPDHVGKVFYERIDDFHGNIFFLNLDIDALQKGQFSWEIEKREIELSYKQYNHDGSGTLKDPTALAEMPAEARMWFGYRRYISPLLAGRIVDSLERNGALENSFSDLFKNSNHYLFDNGIQTLTNGILSGNVEFDLGYVEGNFSNYLAYYYYDSIDRDTKNLYRSRKCVGAVLMVQPLLNQRYTVSSLPECPENDATYISVFNSTNFSSYSFPDEWIISKEDLI